MTVARRPDGLPQGLTQLKAPIWSYRVVKRYPHDPSAFTQGLLVSPAGTLYESTGRNGMSELREVEIATGKVLRSVRLANPFFGEGLAQLGGQLFQLTWQNGKAFVYDAKTFKPLRELTYRGEGWGLTTVGKQLVLSDGSDRLSWRDPKDFKELKSTPVRDGDTPVRFLNELETVEGDIYANVWTSDYAAVIPPASGEVKAWIDLRGLLSLAEASRADVLNGMAYDSKTKRLYVTGKLWPTLFELEILQHP